MRNELHVEILTPRQDAQDLDLELQRFSDKYTQALAEGLHVSLPDNPMGVLHFQAAEVIEELGLPVPGDQVLFHINTFHTREHLDALLASASRLGVRRLLLVTGDGSARLPKLSPESIGMNGNAVTTAQMLEFVHREHPGKFECGVAFNQYEPMDHETEKLRSKIEAGAAFVITQPVIGQDTRLQVLKQFEIPATLGVWMSRKIHLLSECVGYEIPESTHYDPIENLRTVKSMYDGYGLYLALLGFKTQMPALRELMQLQPA